MILIASGISLISSNFALNKLTEDIDYIINRCKLTHAGNTKNLEALDIDEPHSFSKGDIGERESVDRILAVHHSRVVINSASESHVDCSIPGPE